MKILSYFTFRRSALLLMLLLSGYLAAEDQRSADTYVCSEPNRESMCESANTCGSASTPCTVDIKRTSDAASVTPSSPNGKSNELFCVKTGTTVTWKSSSKNTGFLMDFGPNAPFESGGTIIGGSDRSPSTVAKKPGCYKFSAGACVSGAIYGMCGTVDTELVVTNGAN